MADGSPVSSFAFGTPITVKGNDGKEKLYLVVNPSISTVVDIKAAVEGNSLIIIPMLVNDKGKTILAKELPPPATELNILDWIQKKLGVEIPKPV